MNGLDQSARYATIEARCPASPVAAVLVDADTGCRELLVRIEPETGSLTATLYLRGFEAIGRGSAVLTKLSPHTIRTATTVTLNGYDTEADRCRRLEVALSLGWSIGASDPNSVDVVGTALVTDLDCGDLIRFQAVRSHPFNRLQQASNSCPLPADPAGIRLGSPSPGEPELVAP